MTREEEQYHEEQERRRVEERARERAAEEELLDQALESTRRLHEMLDKAGCESVRKDELAELREDKARLDWWYKPKNGPRISYLSRLDSWLVDGNPHNPFENPRSAIDYARANPKPA